MFRDSKAHKVIKGLRDGNSSALQYLPSIGKTMGSKSALEEI